MHTKQLFKQTSLAASTLLICAIMVSCSKKREAALSSSDKNITYDMAELKSLQFKVKTMPLSALEQQKKIQPLVTKDLNTTYIANSMMYSTVDVVHSEIPERYAYMFKKLKVMAPSDSELNVQFDVNNNYVTAYKVIGDDKLLNPVEKSLVSTSAVKRLPLFQYKITNFGVIENEVNENGEKTAKLVIKKTEFESASTVQISEFTQDRLAVDLGSDAKKLLPDLQNASHLNQLVFNSKDLSAIFNFGFQTKESAKYFVSLAENNILVQEIVDQTLAENQPMKEKIKPCPEVLTSNSTIGIEKEKCGLSLVAMANTRFYTAELKKESEDIFSNEINLVESHEASMLVKLEAAPTAGAASK